MLIVQMNRKVLAGQIQVKMKCFLFGGSISPQGLLLVEFRGLYVAVDRSWQD